MESVRPKVHNQVKVGIGVLVCRGDKVLIGKRKGSTGSGKYALPGGHLEMGESFEECAVREVEEETGLRLINARYVATFNSIFSMTCHYVTVFVRGDVPLDAMAANLEPSKCEEWLWVRWDDIPEPIFEPLCQLLASGFNPFHEASQAS